MGCFLGWAFLLTSPHSFDTKKNALTSSMVFGRVSSGWCVGFA